MTWTRWTPDDLAALTELARQGFGPTLIAHRMGRTMKAVSAKMRCLGLIRPPKRKKKYKEPSEYFDVRERDCWITGPLMDNNR
jgi:hypothetical protein